ncbi:MAG: SIR2 family protein [Chthoniobacterales bacterium]
MSSANLRNIADDSEITPAKLIELLLNEQDNYCIGVLGSGLSANAYGNWSNLVEGLCSACNVKISKGTTTFDAETCIDLAERALIADEKRFLKYISNNYGKFPWMPHVEIYQTIINLPFRSFVTTNYDDSLDYYRRLLKPDMRKYVFPCLDVTRLADGAIFYLHGKASDHRNDPNNIILSRSSFEKAYKVGEDLHGFWNNIFKYRSVVVIGSSLDDPYVRNIMSICKQAREHLDPDLNKTRRIIIIKSPKTEGGYEYMQENTPSKRAPSKNTELSKYAAEYGFEVWTYESDNSTSCSHANLYYFLEDAAKISPIQNNNSFTKTTLFS